MFVLSRLLSFKVYNKLAKHFPASLCSCVHICYVICIHIHIIAFYFSTAIFRNDISLSL